MVLRGKPWFPAGQDEGKRGEIGWGLKRWGAGRERRLCPWAAKWTGTGEVKVSVIVVSYVGLL